MLLYQRISMVCLRCCRGGMVVGAGEIVVVVGGRMVVEAGEMVVVVSVVLGC